MPATEAVGHVWTAPGWQELSSRVQQWSEQPYVRPVSAVHVTAGHNALRGSGPGQRRGAFCDTTSKSNARLMARTCPPRPSDRLVRNHRAVAADQLHLHQAPALVVPDVL